MIRAEYVHVQRGNETAIVYSGGVPMKHLRDIAAQLAVMPGLTVTVTRARLSNAKGTFPVVSIVIGPGANAEQLAERIHELAQPKRAITVMRLTLTLLICACDYVSSRSSMDGFLVGFQPDDAEAFMLRYYAKIKQLPVAGLVSNSAHGPNVFDKLLKALEQLMYSLGAHVTAIHVRTEPDRNRCTHR